ncbi:Hypothetical predicted protein [Olea europaea subsp. europaea]|uniref:Uncharacterized protein n=1 Tax=Olea europaea subsp. europaea TaxID=158383 RepID=A0A8S0R990_OLEEU|nr:Hypothetical predicted protein [Olea europaea subsp. europaea]
MLKLTHSLPKLRNFKDIDTIEDILQKFVSVGQELKVFFKVLNQQIMSNITPTLNPNQVVAAFINFLLLIVEVIPRHFKPDFIACVKGSIEILRTDLEYLFTFLGDTAKNLQPTQNIVIDIELFVNEVGSFFYSFLFTIVVFILNNEVEEEEEANYATPHMDAVVDEVRNFLHSDLFTVLEDLPLQISEVEGRKERKIQKKKKRKEQKKAITDIKALSSGT